MFDEQNQHVSNLMVLLSAESENGLGSLAQKLERQGRDLLFRQDRDGRGGLRLYRRVWQGGSPAALCLWWAKEGLLSIAKLASLQSRLGVLTSVPLLPSPPGME